MKNIYRKLIVLGLITVLSLAGCGKTEIEVPEETTVEEEQAPEETTETAETILSYDESGLVPEYKDENKIDFYYWFKVTNNSESQYLCDAMFTVDLLYEDDSVAYTENVSLCTLASGETAVLGAYFEVPVDDINNLKRYNVRAIDGEMKDMSTLTGFKQSDLEIDDLSTSKNAVDTTFVMTLNNANSDTASEFCYVNVLFKKDGKVVGYDSQPILNELKPGVKQTIELGVANLIPEGCDGFDVFIDYSDMDQTLAK